MGGRSRPSPPTSPRASTSTSSWAQTRPESSIASGLGESLFDSFLARPGRSGLFLDFDGTLSEIAHLPSEAMPLEGVPEVLRSLATSFGLVAVVSGRSARQLLDWLGGDLEIWGTHGAERTIRGKVVVSERAAPFLHLMQEVKREAEEELARLALEGVVLEDKGVMLGLHFRAASDVERARNSLERLAADLASRHSLWRAGGRLAFELRPPVELTKRAVVLERSRELRLEAACFIGDDRVDLPAFDALDVLAREGVVTLRVGVASDEAPPELLDRADVVVEGPTGVLELLESFASKVNRAG